MKIHQFSLFVLLLFFIGACKDPVVTKKKTPKQKRETEADYRAGVEKAFHTILADAKLKGSILLFDFQKEKYYSNDVEWAKVERSPASTFKIPNTLIGLETETIASDTSVFVWDGKTRDNANWNKNLTLEEAFKVSCVPCYQELARNIGYDKMKQYLRRFNYGNMMVTKTNLDNFWLKGESAISQYQQIDFIERFYHDGLGISERTTNLMKKIMLLEKTESYAFYGKTGWSVNDNKDNGWFVGFIEVGTNAYFFAVNVEPTKEFNMDNFKEARVEITKKALKEAGLMK